MAESNSVFISYRREASAFVAQAVFQDLQANGIDAFYDIESISIGHFDTIILNQIAARPYFLPILTPGTLERCFESGDWILREISYAVELKREIIPLRTPEFQFTDLDRFLPGTLAEELKRLNMVEIPHRYFRYAMQEVHTRYLKPITLSTTPTPEMDKAELTLARQKASAEPTVTESQLTAQEYFERAYAQVENDQYSEGIANYAEAIRLNPSYAMAYNNRGVARAARGDLDGAIADYDEAIRLNPQLALAYVNRGNGRDAQGEFTAAIADYSEAIKLEPQNKRAFYQRGNVYASNGRLDDAVADYTALLHLDPEDTHAYSNRGEVYFEQSHYQNALDDFEKAIQIDPNNHFAMAGLAITHHVFGHIGEARRSWQSLLKKDKRFAKADWAGHELNWAEPLLIEARKLVTDL